MNDDGELVVVVVPVVDNDAGQIGEHEDLEGVHGPVAEEITGEQPRAGDQQVALAGLRPGADPDGSLVRADHVRQRSEEHTSELQSHSDLVCRLLLEKKKKKS